MWEAEHTGLGLVRYKNIELEGGILKAKEPLGGPLWPFREPTLPTEFYNIRDAKTAIAFERQYAPLGYDSLVNDPSERKGGDPLDWILDHARFVRLALDLIEAIAGEERQQLIKLLNSVMMDTSPFPKDAQAQYQANSVLTFPSGAYKVSLASRRPLNGKDAEGIARGVIAELVTHNTENVRSKLVARLKDLIWGQYYHALIEIVWSMAGELAARSSQGNIDLRKCLWCGAVFQVTHKRQRFCPPLESPYYSRKQSSCGLKYRQHKLKMKKGDQK